MALYQTLEIALTSQKLFISIKFAFFHLNAKRRGLDMKRFLTQWTMPILIGALICGQAVFCTGRANAQRLSRAEAIAQIAARFPNSDKPAEQIYDEGQIWYIAKTFVKQFRNFELGALTGPIAEDRYRTVTKEVPAPVGSVNDGTTGTLGRAPSGPGGSVSDTTGSVVVNESDSSKTITERIDRRSIFSAKATQLRRLPSAIIPRQSVARFARPS